MTKRQRPQSIIAYPRPSAQGRTCAHQPLFDRALRALEHRRNLGRGQTLYDLEHERSVLVLRQFVEPLGQLLELDARFRIDTARRKYVHQRSGQARYAFTAPCRVDGSVSDDAIEPRLHRRSIVEAPFNERLMRVDVRLLYDSLRFTPV